MVDYAVAIAERDIGCVVACDVSGGDGGGVSGGDAEAVAGAVAVCVVAAGAGEIERGGVAGESVERF